MTGSILDAIRTPDLATEITLQPVRRYGVDAADALLRHRRPRARPSASASTWCPARGRWSRSRSPAPADLARLRPLEPEADIPYVLETVRNLVDELATSRSSASPARRSRWPRYLVEGRPSRTYAKTKALMLGEPELWAALIDRLADLALGFAPGPGRRQGAGACSCSTVGRRPAPPEQYERLTCCPPAARSSTAWPTSASPASTSASAPASCSVCSPRPAPTSWAWTGGSRSTTGGAGIGADRACRATSIPPPAWRRGRPSSARCAVCSTATAAGPGHIFNLGHGVLPETDPTVLTRIVELVHERTAADDADVRIGVLVMAYGTPRTPADIEPYYTHIRRGRPPTPEQLAELDRPLRRDRRRVPAGRANRGPARPRSRRRSPAGTGRAARAEARRTVHRGRGCRRSSTTGSTSSSASSWRRTSRPPAWASTTSEPRLRAWTTGPIDDWSDLDPWLDFQAAAVTSQLEGLPADTTVLFTAHSLPERVLEGDVYPDRLAGLGHRHRRPRRPGGLGSGLAERRPHARAVAGPGHPRGHRRPARPRGLLICPQGFTSDHLEVLYDLDIEARTRAEGRGIAFARTASVNDHPAVMAGAGRAGAGPRLNSVTGRRYARSP